MRLTATLPVALALALLPSPAAAQSTLAETVRVEQTTVVDRFVVVTVRNLGSDAITAWGVFGEVVYDDGSSERMGVVVDGWLAGFGEGPMQPFRQFDPGSTATGRFGLLRRSPVKTINLAPTMAIRADGSAVGDEPGIGHVFESRRREYRALTLVEAALGEGVSKTASHAGMLRAVEERLSGLDLNIRETLAYREVLSNIELWRRLPDREPPVDVRLVLMLDRLRQNITRALPQLQRR